MLYNPFVIKLLETLNPYFHSTGKLLRKKFLCVSQQMHSLESYGSPLFSSRHFLTLIIFSIILISDKQLKVNFVFPQTYGVPLSLADKEQYDKIPPTKATTIRTNLLFSHLFLQSHYFLFFSLT